MTAPAVAPSGSTGENRKWWALLAVSIGTFASTSETGMVNVSLPTITTALSIDMAMAGWVILAYLLVFTGLLLVAGRLADLFGRREVYIWGFAVFALGSGLASLSPNIFWLLVARAVQGCGASAITANGPALLIESFPEGERGRALGWSHMVVPGGFMAGPVLGGFFVQLLGWRSVFYLHFPVALAGFIICSKILPQRERHRVSSRLDLGGVATLLAFTTSFILVLNQGPRKGWDSPFILGLAAILAASFLSFLLKERKGNEPLVDFSLFKRSPFTLDLVGCFFQNAMITNSAFLMPFYLQKVLGYQPAQIGMTILPSSLASMFVSPLSGYLSERLGPRIIIVAGMAMGTLSFISYGWLDSNSTVLDILWRLILLGVGNGLFSTPNALAVMRMVSEEKVGAASSLLALFRHVGVSTGVAVTSSIMAARLFFYQSTMSSGAGSLPFLFSLREAWMVAAGFGILATLFSIIAAKGVRSRSGRLVI